jgi:hypothetical protein
VNPLRRLSPERLRSIAGLTAALVFGASAGFLFRGDGSHDAAPATRPATTVTTKGSEARADAVLAARPAEIPTVIHRGGSASVEFQTRPGSSCQLEVQPANGPRDHQRLPTQVADAAGKVVWHWTVADDIPEGNAQAVVVCSGGARAQVAIRIA